MYKQKRKQKYIKCIFNKSEKSVPIIHKSIWTKDYKSVEIYMLHNIKVTLKECCT